MKKVFEYTFEGTTFEEGVQLFICTEVEYNRLAKKLLDRYGFRITDSVDFGCLVPEHSEVNKSIVRTFPNIEGMPMLVVKGGHTVTEKLMAGMFGNNSGKELSLTKYYTTASRVMYDNFWAEKILGKKIIEDENSSNKD